MSVDHVSSAEPKYYADEYHPDEYVAEEREPSSAESTLVTIAMFIGVVAFALGCTVLGWWN